VKGGRLVPFPLDKDENDQPPSNGHTTRIHPPAPRTSLDLLQPNFHHLSGPRWEGEPRKYGLGIPFTRQRRSGSFHNP
jgi:hypothetical protein